MESSSSPEIAPRRRYESVDEMLEAARRTLKRLTPEEAATEMGMGTKLIDTRTLEQRLADGVIPGAIEVGLNFLEWRCDPTSPDRDARLGEITHDSRLIILCDQGYSSSLAAARLQALGLHKTTDVDGGFKAWRAGGLPIEPYREDN